METIKNLKSLFSGRRVCIVGSAPNGLDNQGSHIDGFDDIIRVNRYKFRPWEDRLGSRTDYHYSFYGSSIKIPNYKLKDDGVKAHLCKCPDDKAHFTDWHVKNRKTRGCDFRWIYTMRKDYWIAPVYIPKRDHYLKCFQLLNKHVPTTGFACIWELIQCNPKELYITGFDFFESKMHNVNERWRDGDKEDPIRHMPEVEAEHVKEWASKYKFITLDKHLRNLWSDK